MVFSSITEWWIPATNLFGYQMLKAFWPLYVIYLLAPMFKNRSILNGAKEALSGKYYRYTFYLLLATTTLHFILIAYADQQFKTGNIESFEYNPNRVIRMDDIDEAKRQCRYGDIIERMRLVHDNNSGKLYGKCNDSFSWSPVIYDVSSLQELKGKL